MAKEPVKIVLIQDQTQMVRRARINGAEIEVSNAHPILQDGRIGVSLTILGVELSGEQAPSPAAPEV